MPHYMAQFRFKPEAWAGMIKEPEDRTGPVRALIEGVGGRLIDLYWAFGDYDGVAIFEAPDHVAMGGAMVAVLGSGAFEAVKTTPLFTAKESRRLLEIAGKASYRPPAVDYTFLDWGLRARRARRTSSQELMSRQELRVEEVAQLFGLSPYAIQQAVYNHELPATMIGHTITGIKRADLLHWLEQRGEG